MESFNPFANDEIKDLILSKEGKKGKADQDQYEILGADTGDIKSIIAGQPLIPKTASNLILDASAIAKNEKEQKALEIRQSINDVMTSYNEKYGLNLEIDLNNLSRTLVNVADDKNRRVLELFLSKYFKSMRAILCLHLMSRLTLAIDYITAPERLFSGDLSTADIFIVVEKLISYIDQLQELKKTMEISGEDVELKKIAEESLADNNLDTEESREVIDEFMKLFRSEH